MILRPAHNSFIPCVHVCACVHSSCVSISQFQTHRDELDWRVINKTTHRSLLISVKCIINVEVIFMERAIN